MNSILIVIFGVTGDLSKRKLIPALYRLIKAGKLINYTFIGAGYEKSNVEMVLENAREFIEDFDQITWNQLKEHFIYQQADINNEQDIKKLASLADEIDKKNKSISNRIIYCATASSFFCAITQLAAKTGLMQKCERNNAYWHRIVYEKPFGSDLKSAQEINTCIKQYFNEHQIYRIDHYLLKEFVSNIALTRFTNIVFEPLWNNRYIDSVQIILSETLGVGTRGSYYDAYGAVDDVMQNHMLEILALIGMESPEKLMGEFIRDERAKVLSKVKAVDALFGQYQGYLKESHIDPQSKTETFAVALLRIENPRWAGVPFYLKTGKCLTQKETVFYIKFKQVECLLARNCPSESNYLAVEISPESIMSLSMNVKKPGVNHQVMPVKMVFSHNTLMAAVTPQAYEVLFEEIIRGEESVSVRADEIESAWRIIDQIRGLKPALYSYEKGSNGPIEAEKWAQKHGTRWRL